MTVGIYGIFNSDTEECLYIGQSKIIEERWRKHKLNLKNKNHPRKDFVKWYHDNGAEESLLLFKVLEECENDDFVKNSLEIKWFKELNPKYFGHKPSLKSKWEKTELTRNSISQSLLATSSTRSPATKKLKDNYELVIKLARDEKISKNNAIEKLSVSMTTLNKFLKENNIEWLRKNGLYATDDLILKMYFDEMKSTTQIAKELNVSQPTIFYRMNKYRNDDSRFSEIKQGHNRTKRVVTGESKKKLSESLKKLDSVTCKFCFNLFKINQIERHEKSCSTWPKCKNCDKKLSKRGAVYCHDCIHAKL